MSCASNEYINASDAYNEGDNEVSRQKLINFIKTAVDEEKKTTAILQLGWSWYQDQKYDEAISNFNIILSNYPQSTEAPYASILIAHSFLNENEYGKAIDQYNQTYLNYRTSIWAEYSLYTLAKLAFEEYKFSESIQKYRALIARFPNSEFSAKAHYDMGEAFFKLRKYNDAISNHLICFQKYTNSLQAPFSGYRLAVYEESRGNKEKCIEYLNKIINDHSTSDVTLKALIRKGNLLYTDQKINEATEMFQKALNRYPKERETDTASFFLGEIYLTKKAPIEAIKYFKLFQENYQDSIYRSDALIGLYNLQMDNKDKAGALETAIIITDQYRDNPKTLEIAIAVVDNLYKDKDYQTAASICEKILPIDFSKNEEKRILSQYYILLTESYLKQPEKAIQAYNYYFKTDPPPSFERLSYIRSYLNLVNQYGSDSAKKHANELLLKSSYSDNKEIAQAAYSLATLIEDDENEKKAELYKTVTELDPSSQKAVQALYDLAQLKLKEGNIKEAEYNAKKMMRTYPNSLLCPNILYQIHVAYQQNKNIEKAKEIKEQLLKTYPKSEWTQKLLK